MGWIVIAMLWSALCYGIGYYVRGKVDEQDIKSIRDEMGLEDENCKNCKDLELPCDPNCKLRKEVLSDGKSETNNSEKN